MSVLFKKLLRMIWHTKGQFLAVVAVVMVGIAIYIAMTASAYNLNRSKEVFYHENNFADYYFHVVRAPEQITRQVEAIPGVDKATGRIQKDVPVLKAQHQRATARLISYPLPMDVELNHLQLLTGRLFEKYPQGGGIEVLVDAHYAGANGLNGGGTVTIVAGGKALPLTVVGSATSPEFVLPLKDASSLVPDPKTFGIIMIPHNQAQQILNMPGQINQVVIKLAPGTDAEKVAAQVKALLAPYGNLASYPRKQQLSHAILQGKLDGLLTMSLFLPLIFLGIAAAIQFIMLSRMVKAQHIQIGVMKALGYTNRQIMLHYSSYALMVAGLGALLGTLLGILMASLIAQAYAQVFELPVVISGVNGQAIAYGFLLSLGVGVTAGFTATRGVVAVNPAESMRPESPKGGSKIILEQWIWLWHKLTLAWKMSLRNVARNWVRSGITVIGVMFATGILVMAFFMNDSIDYLLKEHFFREQRYDYLVRFTTPVQEHELLNITRLDSVIIAEPFLEIPVKLSFAGRAEDDLLLGLPPQVTLKKLVSDAGQALQLPEEGIILNQRIANKLGVQVGDQIAIETLLDLGPARFAQIKIIGINRQLIGGSSYMTLRQANRILAERQLVSGAMLKVDKGNTKQLEAALSEMTAVSSVLSREKEVDNIMQNLGMMIFFTAIMSIFAVVLGFAIIYNASVISFAERKQELATLRVLGFTTQEVSGLLLRENLLQSLLGMIIGLPFGRFMSVSYVNAIKTDLYTFPVVVYPLTYVFAALGGACFIIAAHLLTVRGLKQLELVNVLKNSD